jgi:hypothetical protein
MRRDTQLGWPIMRAMALVGLVALLGLLIAGCGSSSAPTILPEPEHVTTGAQVAEMTQRLEKDEELRPVYAHERSECEAVVSEYEWLKECIEPQTEKLARLVVRDEKLINNLTGKVGQGCREAIRNGAVFDRLEQKVIDACKKDVGKAP